MKKIITFLLTMLIALSACSSLFACGGKGDSIDPDATVVKVKAYKAGYGIDWLESAIEKFNALYKDEKYVVMIDEATKGVPDKAFLEIKDIKKNDIDLYFVSNVNIADYASASSSFKALDGNMLLEDLSDVYSSKAISFSKSEETTTIENKVQESSKRFYKFNGNGKADLTKYEGKYYAFPWASGAAGLFVNKSVLANNGLSIPLTTDEMIAQYEVIAPSGTPKTSDVYPMTYAGGNATGYWLYMFDTLFAQYSGVKTENDFWNISTANDGYKIYEDEGILKALEVMSKVVDDKYCKNGTSTLTNEASQKELLQGKAAYMCTGNWVYNEMSLNFSSIVDNMEMIKMPIISALGTKLGYKNDAVLSAVVKGIDDGKTNATIATENSVSEESVQKVRDARNIYFNASVDHVAVIPSYSNEKAVAKLFLRFLASDDNMDLYKTKTNSTLPFAYETSSKVNVNNFISSVEKVSNSANAVMVSADIYTSPIRQQNLMCFGDLPYATVFLDMSQKEGGTPRRSALDVYNYAKDYASNNWSTYLTKAGINN